MLLSILTPSTPERIGMLGELYERLAPQLRDDVEHLVLSDNRTMAAGTKRNHLTNIARGRYVCHIDDDDLVTEDFIKSILPVIELSDPVFGYDLIAYDALASLNGSPYFRVITHMEFENEQPNPLNDGSGGYGPIRRKPWHWCCWRRDLAIKCQFPDHNKCAEDWEFLRQALPLVSRWHKIDAPLFVHRYNAKTSQFDNQ